MINKVILIGNVGGDPEVRRLNDGESMVAKLSLATNETYKDKQGEKVTNTTWHTLEVWNGLAKVVEDWVHKGTKLYVEGSIKVDKWEDDEGNTRSKTLIKVQKLQMLGGNQEQAQREPVAAESGEETDDLPF